MVRALVPTDDEDRNSPGRELDCLRSLIAVCLALLHDASLHGGTARDLIARQAWTAASGWAVYADFQMVADYLYQPDQAHARVATESEVEEVVTLAQAAEDDPTALLYDVFDKEGIQVDHIDGVCVAGGPGPRRQLFRKGTDVDLSNRSFRSRIGFKLHFMPMISLLPIRDFIEMLLRWVAIGRDDLIPTPRAQYPILPSAAISRLSDVPERDARFLDPMRDHSSGSSLRTAGCPWRPGSASSWRSQLW